MLNEVEALKLRNRLIGPCGSGSLWQVRENVVQVECLSDACRADSGVSLPYRPAGAGLSLHLHLRRYLSLYCLLLRHLN
jgi:hypothetical protein